MFGWFEKKDPFTEITTVKKFHVYYWYKQKGVEDWKPVDEVFDCVDDFFQHFKTAKYKKIQHFSVEVVYYQHKTHPLVRV